MEEDVVQTLEEISLTLTPIDTARAAMETLINEHLTMQEELRRLRDVVTATNSNARNLGENERTWVCRLTTGEIVAALMNMAAMADATADATTMLRCAIMLEAASRLEAMS